MGLGIETIRRYASQTPALSQCKSASLSGCQLSDKGRWRKVLWLSATVLAASVSHAQTALVTPKIAMGITLPAINEPASIQVLVTDPDLTSAPLSPVPTGDVTIDFGDGSFPVTLPLGTSRVATTYTYTSLGQFTIQAVYSGDSVFAPVTKSLSTVSVVSAPAYTLHTFGDSLTGGSATQWPLLLTTALGWPIQNDACGGCRTSDMAPLVYDSVVDNKFASTWLLVQNEGSAGSSPLGQQQFLHAVLAENAWLAIPEGSAKLRAQSTNVAAEGSWANSDIYTTTGLRSSVAGSSLTASVRGSSLYAGFTSLLTTNYTVDVLIDGVDQGSVSPVSLYTGAYQAGEPYGMRYVVAGNKNTLHTITVVCQNPGTSGCYVDWVGGNGSAEQPNLPPYVWTGVSYYTLQGADISEWSLMLGFVRQVESQLESDGLAIRLADIDSLFGGPSLPQCMFDQVHPNACGDLILETAWLSSMSYLATEAQRIDVGAVPAAIAGSQFTLDEGEATSGLPVTYTMISGPGTIVGGQLNTTQGGTVVIEADQSGNATVRPAEPVQFSVPVIAPTTTSLSISPPTADLGSSVTLTATVTANGSPVTAGTITFYDGSTSLGSGSLNTSGTASLTTTAVAVGAETLNASYAASPGYTASNSASVTVTVLSPDFGITVSNASLAVANGQSIGTNIFIAPENGFNQTLTLSCIGLPAGVSCTFGAPISQSNGSLSIPLTLNTQRLSSSAMPSSPIPFSVPVCAAFPLGVLFISKRRKVAMKHLFQGIGLVVLSIVALGWAGCGSTYRVAPVTNMVTITAHTQNGLSHSTQLAVTID